jgi:gluconokinase
MTFLCFDISSSGVSAALFNSRLEVVKFIEEHWELVTGDQPSATLSAENMVERFKQVIRGLAIAERLEAICIGTFMHNCVLLDRNDKPLTPVFTWLDQRGEEGIEFIRSHLGPGFHERTGCRFHPMFPVFKLATLQMRSDPSIAQARRVVSVKALLNQRLTGVWPEDPGMASASGMYNIRDGDWDPELLAILKLKKESLPPVSSRNNVVGRITKDAASEFGLPEGIPVVNGSGDGFFAHSGSECRSPERISVTLGTSAAARQALPVPILDLVSGTFCYRAAGNEFLLGCASNNGGNVLEWGRTVFGALEAPRRGDAVDLPIFIPLLHGERSPDWNPDLKASWHGLTARNTAPDLARSVVEGVIFNLGHYIEILQETSRVKASSIVLSGNGFLHPLAAPILAAVAGVTVSMPPDPGLASLRGAGVCALEALGVAAPPLDTIQILPLKGAGITKRYAEYKRLRKTV